jgi:hypothetical protein
MTPAATIGVAWISYIRMTGIRHPAAESSSYYSVVSPAAAESCGEAAALSSQSYSSTVIRAKDTVLVDQTASALQLQLDPAESPASSPLYNNVGPPLQLLVDAGDWNGNQYPVPTWITSKSECPPATSSHEPLASRHSIVLDHA